MELLYSELTGSILKYAYKVHSELGPGLLQSTYEECLYYELEKNRLSSMKQKPMPLVYDSIKMDIGYRIDLIVEGKVIIEVKSVDALIPVHTAQLLTYLQLSYCKIGFLMNFNVGSFNTGLNGLSCDPQFNREDSVKPCVTPW